MDFLTLGKHLSQALEWFEDGSLATLDSRDRQNEEWAQIFRRRKIARIVKTQGERKRKRILDSDCGPGQPMFQLSLSLPRGPSDKLRQFVSSLFLAPTPGLHQAFEK